MRAAGEDGYSAVTRERSTLEIPGGHREPGGRSVAQTAERELREETGAEEFTLKRVCVYSVTGRNRVNSTGAETFGVLYCAEITSFGEMKSEIAEIVLLEEITSRALDIPGDTARAHSGGEKERSDHMKSCCL